MRAVPALRMLIVLAVLCAAPFADAAMLSHLDLRSLFLSSEQVFEGKRISERTLASGGRATTFEVVRSYKGSAKKGERIEVNGPSAYAFAGMGEASARQAVPEVLVLFVTKAPAPPGDPPWHITLSGVRMVQAGKAFRFEQHSNPGPYVPVPHRRDPFDLLGLPGAGDQLTAAQLHDNLEEGRDAAHAVERALLISDADKARAALVASIGPPIEARAHASVAADAGFFRDIAATRILRRLAQLDDLDGVLEAWSRLWIGEPRVSWPEPMSAERFLAAAEDPARATRRRVAALRILGGMPAAHTEEVATRVVKLLGDTAPIVRAEVASWFDNRDAPETVAPALVAAWKTEQHHRVRHALLVTMLRLGVGDQLEGEPRVVTVRREQDVLDVAYASTSRWTLARAVATLRQGGDDVHAQDLLGSGGGWRTGTHGRVRTRLASVPPGTYEVSVVVTMADADGAEENTKLELSPWKIAVPPPPPAPPPEPPPAPAPRIEVMSEFPQPRGCTCHAAGRRTATPWWIAVAVGAALALRRRA